MITDKEYDKWLDEIVHCQEKGKLYNSKDDMDENDYCTENTFCVDHTEDYEQVYKYYVKLPISDEVTKA